MPGSTPPHVKQDPAAPPGSYAVEAAGLRWLAGATASGGAAVVRVRDVSEHRIAVDRLTPVPPTAEAAVALGAALARTHAAGADWFGCPPAGHAGHGFIGAAPMPHVLTADDPDAATWGRFYARRRVLPFLDAAAAAGALDATAERAVRQVVARLQDGDPALCGPPEPVARIHGDLWAGNVVWTARGGVLIDPAAHGGHRETDLAMLALFGLPHLAELVAGYDDAAPLADGWSDRVPVHQLHPLLVHAVLFGGGYGAQAGAAAARSLLL